MATLGKVCFLASFLSLFLIISVASREISSTNTPPKRTDREVRAMFESWLVKHGKNYNSIGEKEVRYQIFKDKLRMIDEGNAENRPYKLGLNHFSDLTREEFRSKYLGARVDRLPEPPKSVGTRTLEELEKLPSSFDWREYGVVGPVKDQRPCGACWAFGTVAAVEAINAIHTGRLVTLSEQQLVDCDKSNYGCAGGYPERAYDYIKNNGGLATARDYPYRGANGTCEYWHQNAVTIGGYQPVQYYDENALLAAVLQQPVVVYVHASQEFGDYDGGIFVGPCGTDLNHIVLVVGYGTENGYPYWLLRNSWSADWGEDGYMKLQRNTNAPYGLCGIAMIPSYPTKNGYNSHEEGGKALSA